VERAVVSSVVRLAIPAGDGTGGLFLSSRLRDAASADAEAFRAAVAALLSHSGQPVHPSDVRVTSAAVSDAAPALVVGFDVTVSSASASSSSASASAASAAASTSGGSSGSVNGRRRMLQASSAASLAETTVAVLASAIGAVGSGEGGLEAASLAGFLAAAAAASNATGMAVELDGGVQQPPSAAAATPPFDPVAALLAEVWSLMEQLRSREANTARSVAAVARAVKDIGGNTNAFVTDHLDAMGAMMEAAVGQLEALRANIATAGEKLDLQLRGTREVEAAAASTREAIAAAAAGACVCAH
jgi:hypothetical protein